jgi:hypothetical protein
MRTPRVIGIWIATLVSGWCQSGGGPIGEFTEHGDVGGPKIPGGASYHSAAQEYTLSAAGALIAFPLVATVQRRWDKKHILLACSIVSLVENVGMVNLRFLDVLPDNRDPKLLVILVANGVFAVVIMVIQGIIGSSIVADLLDDQELHTGYRQEGMFNAASFKKMKRTAVFVNTARGPIVNQKDLHEALKSGTIFAAGLDVTDPEPLEMTDPLLKLPNCVVAPHIASATVGTRNAMAEICASNLIAGLTGEKLPAWVNPEVEAKRRK